MRPRPLFLLAFATLASGATAAADTWSGPDKLAHAGISALLGTVAAMHFESRWTAFGVALIPGLLKEVIDSQKADNHFSGRDLAADALGAGLGVQLGHWIVSRRGVAYSAAF